MKIPQINIKVRVLKSGKKSYFLDYRVNKVRRLEKAGDTKSEAEMLKAMRVTEFKNEKYEIKKTDISLTELLEQFLNSKKNYISKRTTARYRVLLEAFTSFIDTYFREITENASSLRSTHILKFLNHCVKDLKWNPKTVNMAKALVNGAFIFGIQENLLTVNPFQGIKDLPTVDKSGISFYSEEELQRIFADVGEFWEQFFKVLYLTGLRKDELLNLKWSNVNFEQEQITVTSDDSFTTKTKRSRVIPMHQEVVRLLKNRVGIHPVYCFTSPNANTKLGVDKPYHAIKRTLNKLGLSGDVHKFRHTFASHLVMAGVSLETLAELLGHSKIETTQIYAHLSPNFKGLEINKLRLPL